MPSRPAAAIATFGRLAELDAKMAHGILRYCDHIACVLDEQHAGRRLPEIVPYVERDVPVVASLEEALRLGVEELVIGAAPPGGAAGPGMLVLAAAALERGLWVVSGLHERLAELPELARWSERIVELRHREIGAYVGTGAAATLSTNVILTVASDCASGKMTAGLELWKGLRSRGRDAVFVATGQTGMYIAGGGAAIDAVISDFLAGVVEQLVLEHAGHEFVIVEGQGSILHPAYSAVSLGLLHGAAPSMLLFCHDLARKRLAYFEPEIRAPSEEIALLEQLAAHQRAGRVVGVCAMTRGLDAATARRAMRELEDRLGVPVAQPLGADFGRIVERIARS